MTTSHDDVLSQARPVVRPLIFWCSLVLACPWIAMQTAALLFIVPRFHEMFTEFEFDLPRATRWLLAASEWMRGDRAGQCVSGWLIALPLAAVALTGLFAVLRRAPLLAMALVTALVASIIVQVLLLLVPPYTMIDAIGR